MEAIIQTKDLIGVPFKKGGRDLITGVDCFGTLMECYRRMGRVIPDFRSPEYHHEMEEALNKGKRSWKCWWEKAGVGDICPLSLCEPGRTLHIAIKGTACHVGFVYKPAWFIHAWEDTAGVTAERINLWQKRIVGIYEFNG